MRLWIATDYATYTKIKEVLFPAPSRRTYLYEMFVAARFLAFVPTDKRAEAMMETSLLAEPKNDPAAAAWLLKTNLYRSAKATADALKRDAAKFHALFSDPQFAPYIAQLASAAASIDSEQAARAAVLLLTDCTPTEKRAEVASDESAMDVGLILAHTTDAKVAGVILDYLEASKPPFTYDACVNIAAELPEGVRNRAAKLAASLIAQ
jgi:hypothetical protein